MSLKIWSFYHAETGELHERIYSSTDEAGVKLNTPEGHAAIEGLYDHVMQRVDPAAQTVVARETPKAPPSDQQAWDAGRRRWVLRPEIASTLARRSEILSQIHALEHGSQPRALRELAIAGTDADRQAAIARLRAIDDAISSLRSQL